MIARYTLFELNSLIREVLQDHLTEAFWVVAEISEMKVNRTGHCYLELVEKAASSDEIVARARATIWSYTFRMIRPYFETSTGQLLTDGIKVLVQVSVEFHPAYGLSLNVRDIDPTYTLGDLVRRRREIIQKLQEAGVYDMNREIDIPLVPQRIAIISSATAAGYQDFIHQLENNNQGFVFHYRLFEAYMQGSEAVPSILKSLDAIYALEEEFDAVTIIRGGGAQADLSCFDHFDLAFAVAQFPLPVITGIGHEKDDTILDMVAHTRLKTPTAVAEFFITGMLHFQERLDDLRNNFAELTRNILNGRQEEIGELKEKLKLLTNNYLSSRLLDLNKQGRRFEALVDHYVKLQSVILYRYQSRLSRSPALMLERKMQSCSRLSRETGILVRSRLVSCQQILKQLKKGIPATVQAMLLTGNRQLNRCEESLRHLDPQNILKRGFSITLQNNNIVKSVQAVQVAEELETRFHDGSVISKVIDQSSNLQIIKSSNQ